MFFGVFLLLLLQKFYSFFQDKNFYIFITILIFYEALKKSRVFLFHLIQLLINFDKEIRKAATFPFNTGTHL